MTKHLRRGWIYVPLLVLAAVGASPRKTPAVEAEERPDDLSAILSPLLEKHSVPAMAGAVIRGSEIVAIGEPPGCARSESGPR
jgi:hypothetical protein